ncbi:MAG: hypothetical protein FWF53_06485 [Candidatus Azobacteroides sp.]|nr:hypothetical protein [Candidatus Azobacteroides sp.]
MNCSIIQWLTLGALIVTVAYTLIQVCIMKKQYQNDHERSRRENVIDLQKLWIETLKSDKAIGHARAFIKLMNTDVCRQFWSEKEMIMLIDTKNKQMLFDLCECDKCEEISSSDDGYKVEGKYFITLRRHIVNYLNLLEVIFTAWVNSVGDKDMIDTEFGCHITTDGLNYPLDTILSATPIYFPSIKKYTLDKKEIENRKQKEEKKDIK